MTAKPPPHWADWSVSSRQDEVKSISWPRFRAKQISQHYFSGSADPRTWTDLGPDQQNQASQWLPKLLTPKQVLRADDGDTIKRTWSLRDGSVIESVVMGYPNRTTLCISSQAGCGIGCPFCATGQMGLTRNLSAAEITEQFRLAQVDAQELGIGPGHISNVVFMGMGEPLANYKTVVQVLDNLITPAPDGFGLSGRSVTVSTVGLVPRVRQLAELGRKVTLAVSLHAPDDELRDTLVPINQRFPVADVLAAADYYAETTGRRYSIEYALIRNINDQKWRAELLGELLADRKAHVNLIPLNPTPGSIWTASASKDEIAFVAALEAAGVPTTVRDTRGQDISGACGQLAVTGADS